MIRGILLALETPRVTMPLRSWHLPVSPAISVLWFGNVWGMGYAVWGGRLSPKEKLYAPVESNA